MGVKRAAPPSSTQSSTPSQPRPNKRTKRAKTPTLPAPSPPTASTSTLPATPPLLPTYIPHKRPHHPGSLRRLAHALPQASPASNKHKGATLSGAKIGGKSKDLQIGAGGVQEDMYVTRKGGLGFAGYLKKGVAAFLERGASSLTLHAMGAAIPFALSLALAIRDALPGGTPSEGVGEDSVIAMDVRTGTAVVGDEIIPDDEDEDLVYQSRQKSVVTITLSPTVALALAVDPPPARRDGGGAARGQNRGRGRGNARGRGTGRGRGRGVA